MNQLVANTNRIFDARTAYKKESTLIVNNFFYLSQSELKGEHNFSAFNFHII
jgi:hypothetical protein